METEQKYKVIRVYNTSKRYKAIAKNLTESEAKAIVSSYETTKRSVVKHIKQ